jgi:4-nitrophenyl phosphatase
MPLSLVSRYAGLAIDLDGVVVRGAEPIKDAMAFLKRVVKAQVPFVLVTNNATRTPQSWVELLAASKVKVGPEQVVTSGVAAAGLVAGPTPANVLVIGSEALRHALAEVGAIIVEDEAKADTVVVGLDLQLTYDELADAANAIRRGARFIATNPDPVTPTEDGIAPGTGATIAFLRTATGVAPEIVGKPRQALLEMGVERLGVDGPILLVGDQLGTDVAAAAEAGWDSAMVLSGVGQLGSLVGAKVAPTWVLRDLGQLDGPEPPIVRSASRDDLPAIEALLERELFDAAGAADRLDRTLVAVDPSKDVVGVIAWELVGDAAHLRGIVVDPKERGHGTGALLVARGLQRLALDGVELAYLLTPGADDLFESLGFFRVHRDRVPVEVLETATYGEAATGGRALMRRLPPSGGNGNGGNGA